MKNILILLAVLFVIAIISFTLLVPYLVPEPEEMPNPDELIQENFDIPSLSQEDLQRLGPENSLEGIQWLQPNGLYGVIIYPQRLLKSPLIADGKDLISSDLANMSMVPVNPEKIKLLLMNTAIKQVVIPPQPGGNPTPQIVPLPFVSYYVKLEEPIDKQDILTAFVPPSSGYQTPTTTRKVQGKDVYDLPAALPRETHALVFLDETTFLYVLADETVLNKILDGKAPTDPLVQRMKRVPEHDLENSDIVIVASAESGLPKFPPEVVKSYAQSNGLSETLINTVIENFRAMRFTADFSAQENENVLSLVYEALKPEGAKTISKVLIEQVVFIRSTLNMAQSSADASSAESVAEAIAIPETASSLISAAAGTGLLKGAVQYGSEALDALSISSKDVNIDISFKRIASLPELTSYYFQIRRESQARNQEETRIRMEWEQIVQRMTTIRQYMLSYHSENGHFPPATISDANGQPLLSWRVALLPFMGEKNLYEQFKLDEAWDSENNKPLINKMPMIFADPRSFDPTRSTIQLYNSEGTPFAKPTLRMGDVPGQRNTLMFVAVLPENAVEWTRPQSLSLEKTFDEVLQRFGSYLPLLLFSGEALIMQPKNIIDSERPAFVQRWESLVLGKPMNDNVNQSNTVDQSQ